MHGYRAAFAPDPVVERAHAKRLAIAGEGVEHAVRGHIRRLSLRGEHCRRRRDQDQKVRATPFQLVREHHRASCLGAEDDFVVELGRERDRPIPQLARGVHRAVEAPEALLGSVERLSNTRGIREVGGESDDLRAERLELCETEDAPTRRVDRDCASRATPHARVRRARVGS